MTPELAYLQVNWAAHLSYACAASMLNEVLPISDAISVSSVKRRVRLVVAALDASPVAQDAAEGALGSKPSALSALAVDSGWLGHCEPPRHQGRHVNLVAGRACFEDGSTRVYSYVHSQVPSAAARLDEFLAASGVNPNVRVTIFTDGAGEFDKAAKGCKEPMCRILDWFRHRDEVQGPRSGQVPAASSSTRWTAKASSNRSKRPNGWSGTARPARQ